MPHPRPRRRLAALLATATAVTLLSGCSLLRTLPGVDTPDPTPTSTRSSSTGGTEEEIRVLTGQEVQALAESLWEGTDYTRVSEINVVNNNVEVWLFKDDPAATPISRWTFDGAPAEDESLDDIMALYLPRPALSVGQVDVASLYDEVVAGLGQCDAYAMHWQLAHNGVPLVTGQCGFGEVTYRRIGDVTWTPPSTYEDAAGLDALLTLAAPVGVRELAMVQLDGATAGFEGTNPSVANLDGSTCTYEFDSGTWQTYCTEQLTNTPFPVASFDTAKIAGILATMRVDAASLGGVDHDQFFVGWMDSLQSNVLWTVTGDGTSIIYSFDGVRLQ